MTDSTADRSRENELIAKVPIGALFEHYKGPRYKVFGVGRHSETLEMCVYYQSLYNCPVYGDHAMWVRPLEMFLGTVVVDGKEVPRFRRVFEDAR
ncbi:MAG: DUF1653 domain-containing protein [Verrucomicrobia bacterium]|nr:DUF1653 domain-containing protein [Verrucomicrobiota bacterium]